MEFWGLIACMSDRTRLRLVWFGHTHSITLLGVLLYILIIITIYYYYCLFVCFNFVESIPGTPDEIPEIKVALAWAKREVLLSPSNMHLLSSNNNLEAEMLTSPSSSTSISSMSRENYNIFEIIEKLQHESNIFLQADYLNYIYNEQSVVQWEEAGGGLVLAGSLASLFLLEPCL